MSRYLVLKKERNKKEYEYEFSIKITIHYTDGSNYKEVVGNC
jgi:hypothetical protein